MIVVTAVATVDSDVIPPMWRLLAKRVMAWTGVR